MAEILPQDTSPRQAPTRDRVTARYAEFLGRHERRPISHEAAHSRIRTVEGWFEQLIRFYSREGAGNRIERLMTRARLAAGPGSIDASDKALREHCDELHAIDQRGDSARYYLALDGMLPIEEDTLLRAVYTERSKLDQLALCLEARREARRA